MRTTTSSLAWAISGLSLALTAAGILLGVLAIIGAGRPVGLFSHQLTIPFSGAVFAGLGGLVLARHPRHPIAWMLAALGLITGIEVLNLGLLAYLSLNAPGEMIPAPDFAHWLAQWIYSPRGTIPLTLFLLLFPDGGLPSRRWWPVAVAAVVGLVASTAAAAFAPASWEALGGIVQNPFAIQSRLWDPLFMISGSTSLFAMLASMASVVVRFRVSTGIERQQLKWMAYALGIVLLLFTGAVLLFVVLTDTRLATELGFSLVNVSTIVIAVAFSVAVLRHKLYDIDLLINRTLVYGVLTVLTVGSYVLVVGSLLAIFQSRGSLLISLTATGLIAVLFQPVRDRLQRTVNRLLYGQRDEPYDVLSRLGRRLEGPATPGAMLASVVETIAQTLKLPYVAITLPKGGKHEIAVETGQPVGQPVTLPLIYQGRQVGRLLCTARSPGESFAETEEALLQDIANQAAVAVHALQLSAELQRSRQRLVSAREEERRRLRRDLHDGLGPQMASLGLKLDAARNRLAGDPEQVDDILQELRSDVRNVMSDIRRLIYNLRPPALDELGLLPALRASAVAQLSVAGPRVVVEGPENMPALPAAVEVAAYRIAQEAVTNVARHAHARHCYVRLALNNGLHLEVQDDGEGLPESLQAGVGLTSMQERAAELGGQFRIESLPEGGTRVIVHFPVAADGP